jgi:uncharacterized protein (TIGR02588 family)
MNEASHNRSMETHSPHWIEWLTGLVSGLLVLGIISWVAYEAVTQDATPPNLIALIGSDTATDAGRRVEFKIVNRSDKTAAAVTVRGEIVNGGNTLESHEMTLDYVPGHSSARGAFIFSADLSGGQIRIRPTAYAEP